MQDNRETRTAFFRESHHLSAAPELCLRSPLARDMQRWLESVAHRLCRAFAAGHFHQRWQTARRSASSSPDEMPADSPAIPGPIPCGVLTSHPLGLVLPSSDPASGILPEGLVDQFAQPADCWSRASFRRGPADVGLRSYLPRYLSSRYPGESVSRWP